MLTSVDAQVAQKTKMPKKSEAINVDTNMFTAAWILTIFCNFKAIFTRGPLKHSPADSYGVLHHRGLR